MQKLIKYALVFWLLLFFSENLYPQRISHQSRDEDDPVGRIIIETGGNVVFNINSLKKYNEGMDLTDWTRISLSVSGLDDADTWRLDITPLSTMLEGDYDNDIDLEFISISAIEQNPDPTNPLLITNIPELEAVTSTIIQGTGNGMFVIWVSYSVGTDASKILLGERPDYYFVDLELRLVSN